MRRISETVRRGVRTVLPFPLYSRLHGATNAMFALRSFGPTNYRLLRRLSAAAEGSSEPVAFHCVGLEHPFYIRPGTTDAHALVHSVSRRTYEAYLPNPPIRRVLDAGANVGDTAARYLTTFTKATVVALEPDVDNYRMACRNLEPYGARAVVWNVGLWHRDAPLRVVGGQSQIGITVVEAADGEQSDCLGVSVATVLQRMGWDQLDIFKCDIEGAEREVFGSNDADSWLRVVRSIAIETHGGDAAAIVRKALGRHDFRHAQHRELDFYTSREA